MNKKSGIAIRIVLGGYLVFLGVSLLVQAIQIKPSDFALKAALSLLFIGVGGAYAFSYIRRAYKLLKASMGETEETEENERERKQRAFEKPEHDAALYRTAPMPTQEELHRSMLLEETDLTNHQTENPKQERETERTQPEEMQAEEVQTKAAVSKNGNESETERTIGMEVPAEETEETEIDYEEK